MTREKDIMKKPFTQFLFSILLLFSFDGIFCSELTISWQFQSDDWDYLQKVIPMARAHGVERIQLSHHLVMQPDQLWNQKHLEVIQKAIKLAHENSLAVDLWTHELSFGKKLPVEITWPEIVSELNAKYQRIFQLIPDVDGLVLTLAETQIKIYGNQIKELSPDLANTSSDVRIIDLIAAMSNICKKAKKLLIVRTFVYEPKEDHSMLKAMQELKCQLPQDERENLIVMCKCVPHDWNPYYPHNQEIGKFEGLKEWIEIDLGEEFTGQNQIPYSEVDYLRHITNFSRSSAKGYVARVERYDNSIFGTVNEVNLLALGKFARQPYESQEIWEEWASKHYSPKAGPYVISAMRRTDQIVNRLFFPLQQWIVNHSQLPSIPYITTSLINRPVCKWISSSFYQSCNERLLKPDFETLEEIELEKQRAMVLVQRSLDDIQQAKPDLSTEQYDQLYNGFKLEQELINVYSLHQRAVFAIFSARNDPQNRSESISIAKKANQQLKNVNSERVQDYFRTVYPHLDREGHLERCIQEIDAAIVEINH
jgi:hypothetical protein